MLPLRLSNSEASETTFGSFQTAPSTPRSDSPTSLSIPTFQSLTENDTIIAVMGPTGAGKSTFIKVATGTEDVQIGHSLDSCTMGVQAVRCRDPNGQRDVVFVDTPGFDDTNRRDTEILESIASWLEKTYRAGVKLSGVLYLHRVTDNRVTNTILRNLDMFTKLCGDNALSNVIFVTTHWDRLETLENIEEGNRHEKELESTFWKPFLHSGSKMMRFEYSCASAWNVVNSFSLVRKPLEIQREMVDQGKRLEDTAAGQSLFSWFQKTLKELIHRIEYLLKKITSSREDDEHRNETFESQLQEAMANLREVKQQKSRLSRRRSSRGSVFSSGSSSVPSNSSSSSWRMVVYDVYDKSEKKIKSRLQRGRNSWRRSSSSSVRSSSPPTPCDIPDIESFLEAAIEAKPNRIQAKGLTGTIQVLKLARAAVAGVPVPGLQSAIGVALRIAESLDEIKDTDQSLVVLMSNAGQLIRTVCDQVKVAEGYPKPVSDAVDDFYRELLKILKIAEKIKGSSRLQRYILQPDDQRAIIDCNRAMKLALHRLGVRVGLMMVARNEDVYSKLVQIEELVTRMVACYADRRRKPTWP